MFDISSQTKQKLRGKRISKIVKIYANLHRVFKPASRLGFCLFKLDELLMSLRKIRLRYIVKKFVFTCLSMEVKGRVLHDIYIFYKLLSGDNLIVGSYDRRLCWFDMDLSTKPYKTLR